MIQKIYVSLPIETEESQRWISPVNNENEFLPFTWTFRQLQRDCCLMKSDLLLRKNQQNLKERTFVQRRK